MSVGKSSLPTRLDARRSRLPLFLLIASAFSTSAAVAEEAVEAQTSVEDTLRFDIMEFEVRGNSVLARADVEAVLEGRTGFGRGIADVEAARAALEAQYRKKGFQTVVVGVPSQDVRAGVIRLEVTEGRVGRVRVEGADFVLPSEVRASVPSITEGAVPKLEDLRADLSKANTRTSRTITPEFRAGYEPGTVDIDLIVEDRKPVTASVEVNDQYNRSTERWRLSGSLSYDNLFQRGHSASLYYQTAPENPEQLQAFSASYYAPLGYSRTSLLGYTVVSNTDVATISGLAVLGDGFTAGARILHTLPGSDRRLVQSLSFGADYKDYRDQVGLLDREINERRTLTTPVTYLPFEFSHRAFGAFDPWRFKTSVGATFAFNDLVGDQEEFGGRNDDYTDTGNTATAGKREGAEASFIYFSGDAEIIRRIGEKASLTTALDWQVSDAPLISNEQFALGGFYSVRGYREAEALGDYGVRLSFELKQRFTPEVLTSLVGGDSSVDVWAFLEGGHAALRDPLPEEPASFTLGSLGVGAQVDLRSRVFARVDGAFQFKDDPSASGSDAPDDVGDVRLHVSMGVKY